MKTIRRTLLPFLVVLLVSVGLTGCGVSKVKDIEITSFGLESYSLKGLRSVQAVLAVGIDNPAFEFTITDLSGIVKYNGENFASYTADSLTVDKKCSKVYDLPCTATLSDGVGLMQVMSIARSESLEGFTTDVEAHVKLHNGLGKTLRFKDLDLQELTK